MQHANSVLWGPSGYSAVPSVLHIGGPRLGCGSREANVEAVAILEWYLVSCHQPDNYLRAAND